MLLLSVRAWERDSEWELECNIVIVWHKEEEEEAKEAATPTRSPSPLHSYVCHDFVCMCVYVFLWLCDWWCQLLLIRFVSWRYWKNLLQIVSFRNKHKITVWAYTHTHTLKHACTQTHTDTYLFLNIEDPKFVVWFHFIIWCQIASASPGGASAPL